ncbi:MAG: hypothetical protein CMK59_13970 [Proteobacteria bacterium]|nr:hypothetical protein [Pseudomonadota bacterium]
MKRSVLLRTLDLFARRAYRCAYLLSYAFNKVVPLAGRGSYVAVWKNDQILLIKNGYKSYKTFPCGNINSTEGVKNAACRELYEEVGFRVEPDELRLAMVLPYNEQYEHQIVFIYEMYLNHMPTIRIDHREVVEASWYLRQEALREELCHPVRIYLERKARN